MGEAMTKVVVNETKSVTVELDGDETKELRGILTEHLPEFLRLFIRKNNEYGENASTLGPRGQFSDMYRKMIKLRTALWDGNEDQLTSESVEEILMDLIGHCFLTMRMRSSTTSEFEMSDELMRILEKEFTGEPLSVDAAESAIARSHSNPTEIKSWRDMHIRSQNLVCVWFTDGSTLSVGDRVRFRQNLGNGPEYTILGFHKNPTGQTVAIIAIGWKDPREARVEFLHKESE